MKKSAAKKFAAALMCCSMLGSGLQLPTSAEEEKASHIELSSDGTSVYSYQAKFDPRTTEPGDKDDRIHVQQVTLFDQEGKPVKVGSDLYQENDNSWKDLISPGEAGASKRAVIPSAEDGAKGIVKLQFQMAGKKNTDRTPANTLFMIDQSSSMYMYDLVAPSNGLYSSGAMMDNMSCLCPNHYYAINGESIGLKKIKMPDQSEVIIHLLFRMPDFNVSGPTWDSWGEMKGSENLTYRWAADLLTCAYEQGTAYYNSVTAAPSSIEEPAGTTQNEQTVSDSETQQDQSDGTQEQTEPKADQEKNNEEGAAGLEGSPKDNDPQVQPAAHEVSLTQPGFKTYQKRSIVYVEISNTKNTPQEELYDTVSLTLGDMTNFSTYGVCQGTRGIHFRIDEQGALKQINPPKNIKIEHPDQKSISPRNDYGCMDRAMQTKLYVKDYLNKFIVSNDSRYQAGIIMFSGQADENSQLAMTNNLDALTNYVDTFAGGGGTNYEAAFKAAKKYVENFQQANSTEADGQESAMNCAPVHTIFITDGKPIAADTQVDFTQVDPHFKDNYHWQGYNAAQDFKGEEGENRLYFMGLSLQPNEYMSSIASQPRMAVYCPDMAAFNAALETIRTEIQEGFPTSFELTDTIHSGFKWLIDAEHPVTFGQQSCSSEEEELPKGVSISDQTITLKKSELKEETETLSFYIQAVDDAMKESVRTFFYPTNKAACIKYISGSADPGQYPEGESSFANWDKAYLQAASPAKPEDDQTTEEANADEGDDQQAKEDGAKADGQDGEDENEDDWDETDVVPDPKEEPSKPAASYAYPEPKSPYSYQTKVERQLVVRSLNSPVLEVKNSRIAAHKSVSVQEGSVKTGDQVQYTIVLKNQGTVSFDKLDLVDQLDPNLTWLDPNRPKEEDEQEKDTSGSQNAAAGLQDSLSGADNNNSPAAPIKSQEGTILSWTLSDVKGGSIRKIAFQAEVTEKNESKEVVDIPNTARFGFIDKNVVMDTNTVTLQLDPYQEPGQEPEDPTAPEKPDISNDKPISGSSAPGTVSGALTPAGSTITGTDPAAGNMQATYPAQPNTSTLTTRYAASPIATAFGAHPVLWIGVMSITAGLFIFLSAFWKKKHSEDTAEL